jgi:N-acetylglutamate synthase-like GNAT family acetyltransferase
MTTEAATNLFVPGDYWTPQRQAAALERARATMASAEMQAVLASEASEPPTFESPPKEVVTSGGAIATERCVLRRGRVEDIEWMAQLMVTADLPPLFIAEFVEGFIAVEHEGEVVGCGGLELYGDAGVIRSVVVDQRARGLGFGRRMAELLAEDARRSGARDLYLFTLEAHAFWLALGFDDVSLDGWREPARECWQYRYIGSHPWMMSDVGVHSMWKRA